MREIHLSADELIESLLNLEKDRNVCILDSCGVPHLGSHLLIAGFNPVEILEIDENDADKTLEILDKKLSQTDLAAIFTISYDFGLKLNKISPRPKEFSTFPEPDAFIALFECLIIHDYDTKKTFLTGNKKHFDEIKMTLSNSLNASNSINSANSTNSINSKVFSNFSRENYLLTIEKIQELIRCGDTYQTNLTQQIRAVLPENLKPEEIFRYLRQNHPAPFASFLRRKNDVVISASPERFFKVENEKRKMENEEFEENCEKLKIEIADNRSPLLSIDDFPFSVFHFPLISVSPIKGTRPRGRNLKEDEQLKQELLISEKDRAENIMIVDLLRNDIGRVCKFGSVKVEKLCELETHSTLFHLVSTVNGELRENIKFSDIIRAAFPCGSITGAPKIRTMQIIDQLETANRGLSMGAIGLSMNNEQWLMNSSDKNIIHSPLSTINCFDLSVAIRTMVIRDQEAIFNVGGGIVIDSNPEQEYEETLTKAKALLDSINAVL